MKTRSVASFLKQVSGSRKEEDVQRAIIHALTALGYIVLQTSEHRGLETCPHCHKPFHPHQGRGSDYGVPDLLVHDPDLYPPGMWVGLEIKGPKTALSSAQEALRREGAIIVCRGVPDALAGLQMVRESLDGLAGCASPLAGNGDAGSAELMEVR